MPRRKRKDTCRCGERMVPVGKYLACPRCDLRGTNDPWQPDNKETP